MLSREAKVLIAVLVLIVGGQVALFLAERASDPNGGDTTTIHAPGVTAAGVTDPETVSNAHRAVLGNESYTLRVRTVLRYPNRTLVIAETLKVGPSGRRYYTKRSEGDFSTVAINPERLAEGRTIWVGQNVTVVRELEPSGIDVRIGDVGETEGVFNPDALFRTYFADTNRTRVEQTTQDGRLAYRLSVRHPMNSSDPQDDFEAVAVVDTFGIVRRARIEAPTGASLLVSGGRVTITVRYTDIGNTTVSRPAWVDDALADLTDDATGE